MGQLGLHIRISDRELARIEELSDAQAIYHYIVEELEESKFESGDVAETDKSWSYIHAALLGVDPDGPLERDPKPVVQDSKGLFRRSFAGATAPPLPRINIGFARYAIVGMEEVISSEDLYVGLSRKYAVPAIAAALNALPVVDVRRRVAEVHLRFTASGSAEDASEYVASWYPGLVEFYSESATMDQHVLFNVSF